MKLRQLIEGQKEQIAGLRKAAPVALYHPTSIEDAMGLLSKKTTDADELMVTPSLKHAVQLSDVVMQFYGRGKDLYPPRETARNRRDAAIAQEKYPESFRPLVSFSLLSQRPQAIYRGFLTPSNVEKIFLMRDGRPEAMSIQQFVDFFVKHRATQSRRKQRRVDVGFA